MAAGLSAAGTQASAVDASDILVYSIGSLRVRPHVAVSEQYNDNIFYRSGKPIPIAPNIFLVQPLEDDFITTVSPAINLQLGRLEANHILFSYEMNQAFYARHSEDDHRDHILSLNLRLQGNRLTLDGGDSVQFLSGILGGGFGLAQGLPVDRTLYLDHYRLEYTLGNKTSVYLEGSHDTTDYKTGTALYDATTLRGTGGFAFHTTPKTSLFGEFYYGRSVTDPNLPSALFPKQPDLDFFGGFMGARGDFTSKLNGTVKVGYETRYLSDNTPGTSTPVVEASLEQKFSDRTSASLSYSRRSAVSVQSVQVASSSYTTDTVTAALRQVLTADGKLLATVGGSFENDGYEKFGTFARRDRAYRANFALTYNIQLWLSTSLTYEFERYASNLTNPVVDYDANRVTFRVSVGY